MPLPRPVTRRVAAFVAAIVVCLGIVVGACAGPSPSGAPSATTAIPSGSSLPASDTPSDAPGPSASGRGSTNPPLPTGPDALALEPFAAGLDTPIGLAHAGDGSGRLYVLEQVGRVRVVERDGTVRAEPFIDLSGRVLSGGERGLLGIAFHPDYPRNRRLFVHYSRAGDGATVVSELRASADGRTADPSSERILLGVTQPFPNHNGGRIAFGPDGYLYIGLGDGGSGGDPYANAQNTNVLLGKLLRIDVDRQPSGGRAYAIPRDNPFAPQGIRPDGGAPEIWAYGLRNPWQFSFDTEGGDLYIGDVGQGRWEEVNRQPGDSRGGENYGWAVMEGRHCYVDNCEQAAYVKPIAEYSHREGCSITGGYVYRGARQPELQGIYVFGDYCSGLVFTLHVDEGTVTPKVVLDSGLSITSFGVGEDGEIYLADIGGSIGRVVVAD
ncbi:MAG TPA: PQQ-dependent sugar dehydrogenase [Candidatus Limnocylindria bacterium]|jgi:glucose/arabinose dehydrogenase